MAQTQDLSIRISVDCKKLLWAIFKLRFNLHFFWSRFLFKFTIMSLWHGKAWSLMGRKCAPFFSEFMRIRWNRLIKAAEERRKIWC
jgi:hypothetical protein